ncbi:MAG: HAD hydrolase-like protein [Phycisphaeraceae bacterium]|nr:HAD hydrolase-like protein [Phycisphaeraceae bacterium]
MTLILFDIDATMLTTKRAGIEAIEEVGRELFGTRFAIDGVSFAGSLDPVIIAELIARHGGEPSDEAIHDFRVRYTGAFERALASEPGRVRALPGVRDAIDSLLALRDKEGLTLGVLTGNYPETGAMKIAGAGIDPAIFEVCVWGSDSPHRPPRREHLPPVAFERYHARRSVRIAPERVTIIGDTPHDVSCALLNGCRCLGVGTGMFSAAQLLESGAQHAVDDLSDTRGVVDWLLR